MRPLFALALALASAGACRKAEKPAKTAETAPDSPSPVKVAPIARRTLAEVISGPGHTAALMQQKVRAPFAGTLVELKVADGDSVRRGQAVGSVVSRETEAALTGAREMLREARTPAERADAERAVLLAERNLVRKPLIASADGPVLSHAAASGDRVTEDQEILTIEDSSSNVFLADIPQNDLARVRPGQTASVDLGGGRAAIAGAVHGILPSANPADFTGPVRIDFPRPPAARLPIGLFGTARITVGEHRDAVVVPDAAVLRDDVTGESRIAVVAGGRLHWIAVKPGLRADGATEVSAPEAPPGAQVVVSGMVGLPEGKAVAVQR
ncbi:MAG: efflux RND transporter periplasmic adaptor subunit [Acidobacteriota bacterium]|nr:efflux RND transporter periplasmic adaptor subunit [Acidobacteriota bacterium]